MFSNFFSMSASMLVFMYFVSSFSKLFNFSKTVNGLRVRAPYIPHIITNFMIIAAILIEFIAPLLIVYASIRPENKKAQNLALYSCYLLVIFTILATLLYHFPPNISARYYPFMSNLATTGGLLVLTYVFLMKLNKQQ